MNALDPKTIESYERLRNSLALMPDLGLSLIEITGDDRVEWLNGQATNDIRGLIASSEPVSFCLCEATGQIRAICDVWSDGHRLLVSTDKEGAACILSRSETMVILEDVQARDLSGEFHLRSVQGPESRGHAIYNMDLFENRNWPAGMDMPEPVKTGIIALRSHRLGAEGWDLWMKNGFEDPFDDFFDPSFEFEPEDAMPASPLACEIVRIESGNPKRAVDYTAKTLPPELGPAFEAKHVSYNKGCYMGQEVLMRIHSRGHTNKTWVGLILEAPVQPGDKVSHASREDAGVITSAAISPTLGPIAAATLRNEAAARGEIVMVGSIRGTVHPMPLRAG